jgi:hypothetical protein
MENACIAMPGRSELQLWRSFLLTFGVVGSRSTGGLLSQYVYIGKTIHGLKCGLKCKGVRDVRGSGMTGTTVLLLSTHRPYILVDLDSTHIYMRMTASIRPCKT